MFVMQHNKLNLTKADFLEAAPHLFGKDVSHVLSREGAFPDTHSTNKRWTKQLSVRREKKVQRGRCRNEKEGETHCDTDLCLLIDSLWPLQVVHKLDFKHFWMLSKNGKSWSFINVLLFIVHLFAVDLWGGGEGVGVVNILFVLVVLGKGWISFKNFYLFI